MARALLTIWVFVAAIGTFAIGVYVALDRLIVGLSLSALAVVTFGLGVVLMRNHVIRKPALQFVPVEQSQELSAGTDKTTRRRAA